MKPPIEYRPKRKPGVQAQVRSVAAGAAEGEDNLTAEKQLAAIRKKARERVAAHRAGVSVETWRARQQNRREP